MLLYFLYWTVAFSLAQQWNHAHLLASSSQVDVSRGSRFLSSRSENENRQFFVENNVNRPSEWPTSCFIPFLPIAPHVLVAFLGSKQMVSFGFPWRSRHSRALPGHRPKPRKRSQTWMSAAPRALFVSHQLRWDKMGWWRMDWGATIYIYIYRPAER